MERNVDPDAVRPQQMDEQGGQEGCRDNTDEEEILGREFVLHLRLTNSANRQQDESGTLRREGTKVKPTAQLGITTSYE
jgi:hypothetical protein